MIDGRPRSKGLRREARLHSDVHVDAGQWSWIPAEKIVGAPSEDNCRQLLVSGCHHACDNGSSAVTVERHLGAIDERLFAEEIQGNECSLLGERAAKVRGAIGMAVARL